MILFESRVEMHQILGGLGNIHTSDSFENQVGHFFARDAYNGHMIIFVVPWDIRNPNRPI